MSPPRTRSRSKTVPVGTLQDREAAARVENLNVIREHFVQTAATDREELLDGIDYPVHPVLMRQHRIDAKTRVLAETAACLNVNAEAKYGTFIVASHQLSRAEYATRRLAAAIKAPASMFQSVKVGETYKHLHSGAVRVVKSVMRIPDQIDPFVSASENEPARTHDLTALCDCERISYAFEHADDIVEDATPEEWATWMENAELVS